MKTKMKLFLVLLSMLSVFMLSILAVACGKKEDTVLNITSETEITIEIGEEYELKYTCAGNVTVTVSGGGTYNEDTKIYTANAAGNWVLTVKGEETGKNPVEKTVSITVTEGADKSALNTAIAKTEGLVESDYTAESWQSMQDAKAAATAMLSSHGDTAEEIAATAKELDDAITDLVKATIAKAVVSADGYFTVGTKIYSALWYKNVAAVAAKITALNTDANVVLKSVYEAKLSEILTELEDAGSATLNKDEKITNGIKIEDGVITVSDETIGWDDGGMGKKVVFNNLLLDGAFSVVMDVTVDTSVGNQKLAGLFLLDWQGNASWNYAVVNFNDPFLGVSVSAGGKDEPHTEFNKPDSSYRLRVIRYQDGEAWKLKVDLLDGTTQLATFTHNNEVTGDKILLGVQVENVKCVISNIALLQGTIVDRSAIGNALAFVQETDKKLVPDDLEKNFGDCEELTAYKDARQEVYDAYYTPSADADRLAAAVSGFTQELIDALMAKKLDVINLATTAEDGKSFTYNAVSYTNLDYKNIVDVTAKVAELNETVDDLLISEYEAAMQALIDQLVLTLQVTFTAEVDGSAFANNGVIVNSDSITITAGAEIGDEPEATYTYAWKVDGADNATTTAAITLTDLAEGDHTAVVTVTHKCDQEDEPVVVSKTFKFAVVKSDVATHPGNWDEENKTYTLNDRVEWGDWEGRKLVFNDLVFNGSFSVQMDVKFDEKTDGANVVTIHLLNADTLTRNDTRDNAIVSYGCICLHENPVRLETGGNPGKKQSSDGGFESVAAAMDVATQAGAFAEGQKFTVKLDVYRTAHTNGTLSCDFSVLYNGEWITFARENDWGGDWSGGFIVGVNVEHAKVTIDNFHFELLEDGTRGERDCVAGVVKSKADLYTVMDVNLDEYASSDIKTAYVEGLEVAKAAYDNNSTEADYKAAYEMLKPLYEALASVVKPFDVEVSGYYTKYLNVAEEQSIVADFGENAESVSNVHWVYTFTAAGEGAEAQEGTQDGLTLTVGTTSGTYSNVKLAFDYNGVTLYYDYSDITVSATVPLNSSVLIGSNPDPNWGSVKVEGNGATTKTDMDWGRKDAIYLDGVRAYNFEMSFDVKFVSGENKLFALNLFGERATLVCRFGAGELGFDEFNWNNEREDEGADHDRHYIGVAGGADALQAAEGVTFNVKVSRNENGTYDIVFAVYSKSGDELAKRTWNGFDRNSNDTEIRFTVEHTEFNFENFSIMYN